MGKQLNIVVENTTASAYEGLNLEGKVNELRKVQGDFKSLETYVKGLQDNIKKDLKEQGLKEATSDNFKVTLTQAVKKSFDEENLIKWAKEKGLKITKKVEVIDEEKLEDMIYHGDIDPSELAKFEQQQVSFRLNTKYTK